MRHICSHISLLIYLYRSFLKLAAFSLGLALVIVYILFDSLAGTPIHTLLDNLFYTLLWWGDPMNGVTSNGGRNIYIFYSGWCGGGL
jgi:hypothetical protein